MSEGTIMETMIAGGAVLLVVGAVSTIIYRITMGDGAARRLDKLKDQIEKDRPAAKK
jgi:hypothetical protein